MALSSAAQRTSDPSRNMAATELQAIIADKDKEDWSSQGSVQEAVQAKLRAWMSSAAQNTSNKKLTEPEPTTQEVF